MKSMSPERVNGADPSVEAPGMKIMSPDQVNDATGRVKNLTLTAVPRISAWGDAYDYDEACDEHAGQSAYEGKSKSYSDTEEVLQAALASSPLCRSSRI